MTPTMWLVEWQEDGGEWTSGPYSDRDAAVRNARMRAAAEGVTAVQLWAMAREDWQP